MRVALAAAAMLRPVAARAADVDPGVRELGDLLARAEQSLVEVQPTAGKEYS